MEKEHRDQVNERQRKRRENVPRRLFQSAKQRAKKLGLEFYLNEIDVVILVIVLFYPRILKKIVWVDHR